MTPDLQGTEEQYTVIGWIAHAHPHQGGLPDHHFYSENHTSTLKA